MDKYRLMMMMMMRHKEKKDTTLLSTTVAKTWMRVYGIQMKLNFRMLCHLLREPFFYSAERFPVFLFQLKFPVCAINFKMACNVLIACTQKNTVFMSILGHNKYVTVSSAKS